MTYKLCSLQDDLFQVLCSRHKDLIRSHVVSQHYKLGDGLDILSKIYRGLMIKIKPDANGMPYINVGCKFNFNTF
jgi:hypothetical protein